MTFAEPELLAHHYTEAGLIPQAIPYWQQAGQRASQRSANAEAVSHITMGLQLLQTLPETSQRAQQELTLQLTLGALRTATHGFAAPEVAQAYSRARELCEQTGEKEQIFPALVAVALDFDSHLRVGFQPFGVFLEYLLRFRLQLDAVELIIDIF